MRIKSFKLSPFFLFILVLSIQNIQAQTKTSSATKTSAAKTNTTAKSSVAKTANGLSKTKSGLTYKIFPAQTASAAKAKAGEFVRFDLKYTLMPKDSLLQSSYGSVPDYAPVDTSAKTKYSFMEIIPKMCAGDSAEVIISVDTLVKRKIMKDYNPVFQKGASIQCNFTVTQIFTSDSAMQEDFAKEMALEKDREVVKVKEYMAQQNLKGIKTTDGAYVVIENAGDTLQKADSGTVASIKYKGYLFNGNVFDTNMDSSKGHTDPIEVPVGQHRVILGWDESLPYFGKGGKGKILVPAMLAYGPRAMGADIPAFANLVFDVEILDVKKADASSLPPAQ